MQQALFRHCSFSLLALALAMLPGGAARAQEIRKAADWAGTWRGSYVCLQGTTGLTLTIRAKADDSITATFSFHAVPLNPTVPAGSFVMKGQLGSDPTHLRLVAGAWRKQPIGYVTVDLEGDYNARSGEYFGKVDFAGCSDFTVRRDLMS